MLPFITKTINNPWGQYELNQWYANGSQRDRVIYNPHINARFIAKDKNTYSASIKVKSGEYKNFWLVPITRRSFLFIAYVPQLEFLKDLVNIQVVQKILPKFSFLSSIYNMQDSSQGYIIDENTRIGSGAIILKVEESLDDFVFPWRGCIDNEEVLLSYAKLNAIYSKIITQIEKLIKIVEDVNVREIEAIEAKQKQILNKTLIKTGVKLVALCVAPYAVAAIDGVDLLVDGMDVFDMDMFDLSSFNFDDNLLDLGDTDIEFDTISDFDIENSDYLSDLEVSDNIDSIGLDGYDSTDSDGITFRGKDTLPSGHKEDGYINEGDIKLESTVSEKEEKFRKFTKGGSDYVLYNGNYIKLTGNTVTIGGIKYDVP